MTDPQTDTEVRTPPAAPGDSPKRAHRVLVPTLLVLATLIGFVGGFAVWVNRQALNTNNYAETSSKLLADKEIQNALGTYLVNELFTNVDVAGTLEQRLPGQAKALAGPAAAGLQQFAEQRAPKFLARPRVQAAWVASNVAAHKQLLRIIDGGSGAVSTTGGVVTLDLRSLVDQLASSLGIQSQVDAARAKVQGSAGTTARGLAQEKLGITLPPQSGQLVIMRSNELKAAQDVAGAIKGLALILPILAILLFALAIWLARGWRRETLRTSGWCFFAAGLLLLLTRRVVGNEVVDSLVKIPSNKPAVHNVWDIGTSLLYSIAVAMIVYGIVAALAAWLGGPTRPATAVRRALAPTLRDSPVSAYATVGGLLLLLVIWGPTPAFRTVGWVLVFAALLALGLEMLRRQAALEFPDAQHGDTSGAIRARWAMQRDRSEPQETSTADSTGQTLSELERLAALHAAGGLTDSEFETVKSKVVHGG